MSDLIGQRLGQYEILARIAKGSAATIYKAYQPKLDRLVAIKVLSPHVIDEEGFLERFAQEAIAIAQLDHPNIVPVYDFDRLGELVYIVMKYVEGGTLKDMMTSQPMELGLAVDLVAQVGLALGYAHKRGVVHRDVKPSNVLIAEGNWALLTDFGLAKMMRGDRQLTRSGIGMGTPDYISPEQAQGFPVDRRTDLYSLGVMLYEMVTGCVPFEAESSMAVVVKHMTEEPRSPREYNPNLPAEAEAVILTALQKDPDRRFQSSDEFIAALISAGGQAAYPLSPSVMAAARSITAASQEFRAPPPVSPPVLDERAWADEQPEEQRAADLFVAPAPPPRDAGRQITRSFTVMWAKKPYRFALLSAVPVMGLFACALLLVVWGLWQALAGSPGATPVAARMTTVTVLPSRTRPPETPTPTPTPEPSATPTLTPSPTPALVYLSPDARITAGIYVKVVKDEGLNLHRAAGFNAEYITTRPKGSILYVLSYAQRMDNLSWIRMRDLTTGIVGWGVQDNVIAFALPMPTPTP